MTQRAHAPDADAGAQPGALTEREKASIRRAAIKAAHAILAQPAPRGRGGARAEAPALTRSAYRSHRTAPSVAETIAAFGSWERFLKSADATGVPLSEETTVALRQKRRAYIREKAAEWARERAQRAREAAEAGEVLRDLHAAASADAGAADRRADPTATPAPDRVDTTTSTTPRRRAANTPRPEPKRIVWNEHRIAHAVAAWIERNGREPKYEEFTRRNGLPGKTSVERHVGSTGRAIELARGLHGPHTIPGFGGIGR